MKKAVMLRWVKALRSGKYKQAKAQLATHDDNGKVSGHCCLGVLCELAKKSKAITKFNESDGEPNEVVTQWAGLKSSMGEFSKEMNLKYIPMKNRQKIEGTDLATLNDRGATFKQIAQFIEKNYKEL